MATDLEQGDKTEPPTERRRREVRERGQVARSVDLTSAAMVLASAIALNFLGADLAGALGEFLRESLSAPAWSTIEPQRLAAQEWGLARLAVRSLLPTLGLLTLAAVAVNLLQVGFLATTQILVPDLERVNPIAGLRRLFAVSAVVRFTADLLKILVLATILSGFIASQWADLLGSSSLTTAGFAQQVGGWLTSLGFRLALGLAGLAVLDYGFQLWSFEQSIRMTKQEVRDELREMEGDGPMRQRRRELHRGLHAAGPATDHSIDSPRAA
ncbi:MAG: EscU/YscU/HrcU family type III secretion system export apparatus switch protein [Planctomycetaceae bacterium]|nr:EscU/YscU/HrcU family type III secretion system export apparatus switch protein [Planctomycetaceae bacterium]